MNLVTLADELAADPEELGYAAAIAAGADGDVAALLNAPRYPTVGRLPIDRLQAWMMAETVQDGSGRSIWTAMRAAADGDGPARDAAREAMDLISARFSSVDLSLPRPAALLAGYAAAGLVSEAQREALVAMATTQKSRAEMLGLGAVSATDVAIALRGSA